MPTGGGAGLQRPATEATAATEEPAAAPVAPAPPTPHEISGVSATASSELSPQGSSTYYAGNVLDGDNPTAWEEGRDARGDAGIGEWIEIDLGEPTVLTAISVIPGYLKKSGGVDRYWSNSRVRRATFTFSDGSTKVYQFKDEKRWQTVNLSAPITATWVRMTIDSVYAPHKSSAAAWDTSVSEIKFKGWTVAEAGTGN
jgi:hypothetical protein